MSTVNIGRRLLIAGVLLPTMLALPLARAAEEVDDDVPRPWQEQEPTALPPAPVKADLNPFYVSAATRHDFFIDLRHLAVDADGVVRYTLVVETADGARNVSFEGIRCSTREWRLYASGRADGEWAKARRPLWSKITNVPANRHHAALYYDYFCPGGAMVETADEARQALRLGQHPLNRRPGGA